MNLLENHIIEVYSIEELENGYIEIDLTVNCYGNISRTKHLTSKEEWEQDKLRGYYWA